MVLGFILSGKYARPLLFYYIVFVSPHTTIKIAGYCDIGNSSKVLQHTASIAIWRYDIINIILYIYTHSMQLLSKPIIILRI